MPRKRSQPLVWNRIATAPKDKELLVFDAGSVSIAVWDGDGWVEAVNGAAFDPPPTHWMPLPEPPKETA